MQQEPYHDVQEQFQESETEGRQQRHYETAKITEIIMMDSAFGKYATYKIAIGDTPIQRRYNHFQSYYQAMAKCWPGIYVPRLPQKQPIGNLEESFLRSRRRLLQHFLDEVQHRDHLWRSAETEIFLSNGKINFESHTLNTEQIYAKYQQVFPNIVSKQFKIDEKHLYTEFRLHIQKIRPMIDNFKKMCSNFLAAMSKYRNEYSVMLSYVLPEVESTLLFKKETRFMTAYQNNELCKPPVVDVTRKHQYEQILFELSQLELDAEAYAQVFDQVNTWDRRVVNLEDRVRSYQSELQATMGEKRGQMKELFFGTREKESQKLQIQIQNANQEIQNLKQLIDIAMQVMTNNEIRQFKQQKEENFYKLLKVMGTLEFERLQLTSNFWMSVMNSREVSSVEIGQHSLLDSVLYTHNGARQQNEAVHEKEQNQDESKQLFKEEQLNSTQPQTLQPEPQSVQDNATQNQAQSDGEHSFEDHQVNDPYHDNQAPQGQHHDKIEQDRILTNEQLQQL